MTKHILSSAPLAFALQASLSEVPHYAAPGAVALDNKEENPGQAAICPGAQFQM